MKIYQYEIFKTRLKNWYFIPEIIKNELSSLAKERTGSQNGKNIVDQLKERGRLKSWNEVNGINQSGEKESEMPYLLVIWCTFHANK